MDEQPLSELVLLAIAAMLGEIRVSTGYFTDIGLGQITTEPTQVPEVEIAHTVITETEITADPEKSGKRVHTSSMKFVVEFCVPRTDAFPARLARRGRADIVRVLTRDPRGQVQGLRFLALEDSQKLILDDERRSNYVIAQVTARAGLSETFSPATNP